MTKGLMDANIDVLCGIDSNPYCQHTYQSNNRIPFLNKNILDVTVYSGIKPKSFIPIHFET